ncbi:cytochrome c oxidase subunit II [Proteobacteria bacterium 005FR1]|nr:cytochrome c oxidase subunit II [Proteobacteria bacterium 005FR1]
MPAAACPIGRACLFTFGCTLLFTLTGCDGPQSTLSPAGTGAARILTLFWWMAGFAFVIWLIVFGIAVYASRPKRSSHSANASRWLIIGGGAIFPTVVLTLLLVFGFRLMADLRTTEGADLRIAVTGERWWWRVRYLGQKDQSTELANEIRLPLGKRIEFILDSPDVIHSFWIPSLGGKVDMIPGRINKLVLEPTRVGVFRGVCAEYCGTSHALMNFKVVVMQAEDFEDWLATQAEPAAAPRSALARQGKKGFFANGCSACHTIRGTSADGEIGPDLTHVGSRLSLGADILPTTPEAFRRWIAHTEEIKPGVKMPSFGMLPDEQLQAMAAYLSGLQ